MTTATIIPIRQNRSTPAKAFPFSDIDRQGESFLTLKEAPATVELWEVRADERSHAVAPLQVGVSQIVNLQPNETRLFSIALIEGEFLETWAFAMGNFDFYIYDRFGQPVAYGLEYTNPAGNAPEGRVEALGTGEYIIKVVSYADKPLWAALHARISGDA